VNAPATLRWAVRLLFFEGSCLALVTIGTVYLAAAGKAEDARGAWGVTTFLALLTALLLGIGFALHRRQRWARGPGIVVQMLMMPLGWAMITQQPYLGAPLFLLGLAGAVLLFAPSTRIALGVR
jgi:hypothetical protein